MTDGFLTKGGSTVNREEPNPRWKAWVLTAILLVVIVVVGRHLYVSSGQADYAREHPMYCDDWDECVASQR